MKSTYFLQNGSAKFYQIKNTFILREYYFINHFDIYLINHTFYNNIGLKATIYKNASPNNNVYFLPNEYHTHSSRIFLQQLVLHVPNTQHSARICGYKPLQIQSHGARNLETKY